MAFRFRKSFKIGKGLRMNVSKRGIGMSVGKTGMRKSIHSTGRSTSSIGIPGTGLSYRKQSSLKKTGRRSANTTIPSKTVPQTHNTMQNEAVVAKYHDFIKQITTLHQQAVQPIDWVAEKNTAAPFAEDESGPHEKHATEAYQHYQPNLIDRIFSWRADKKRQKLQEAITAAKEEDNQLYENWFQQTTLATRVLDGNLAAYRDVIENNKQFAEMSKQIKMEVLDKYTVEATVQAAPQELAPNKQLILTKTGKVSRRKIGKKAYFKIVQNFVSGHAFWTARHLFATLPIENCIVHMTEKSIDKTTGHPKKRVQLSVVFDRKTMDQLNIHQLDPYLALENFEHHVDFLVTKGFRPVKKVST